MTEERKWWKNDSVRPSGSSFLAARISGMPGRIPKSHLVVDPLLQHLVKSRGKREGERNPVIPQVSCYYTVLPTYISAIGVLPSPSKIYSQ